MLNLQEGMNDLDFLSLFHKVVYVSPSLKNS